MSSRVERVEEGYPKRGNHLKVIRTRPHRCSKNCPDHLTPTSALKALKAMLTASEEAGR